jgi:hypothetical protein
MRMFVSKEMGCVYKKHKVKQDFAHCTRCLSVIFLQLYPLTPAYSYVFISGLKDSRGRERHSYLTDPLRLSHCNLLVSQLFQ